MLKKPDLNETYNKLIKLKEEGKTVVGIIPHSIVPDELIHASDSVPLHFCLGGTEDQMNLGDNYVNQTTCGFQRVNLGIFETKESISYQIYNLIDFVIAGTYCAGVQNTGMYLEHYFGKEQYRLIIPYYNNPNPFNYYLKELMRLKKFLEKKNKTPITKESLNESIQFYNTLRRFYQEMDKLRQIDHPTISLYEIQNLIYHLYLNGPDSNLEEVTKFFELLRTGDLLEKKGVRVFLSGNGILFEDDIIPIIENCNCIIAGDDISTGFEFYSSLVQEDSTDPLLALATRYLRQNFSGRMLPEIYRIERIAEICRKRKIMGIINNCLKFCDSYSCTSDIFKEDMYNEGIPVLNLERDFSQSFIGQLKTRIEAFMEILRE